MVDESTRGLLRAATNGDQAAWMRLDARLRETLRLAVRGRVPAAMRAHFDTEVVLQSAFAATFLAIENRAYEYLGKGSLRSFLKTVFENKLNSHVRHVRAGNRDVERESGTVSMHELLERDDPVSDFNRADDYARLLDAMGQLDQDLSHVLVARYFDKRPLIAIAEDLKVSERTARRMMTRALVSLRDLVGKE